MHLCRHHLNPMAKQSRIPWTSLTDSVHTLQILAPKQASAIPAMNSATFRFFLGSKDYPSIILLNIGKQGVQELLFL